MPSLLDRPLDVRCREFQYRFGQSVVFGLPVIALEWFGRSLGGPESDRWVTLFQALLAGWVLYVAAAGMLTEAVLLLAARHRMPAAGLADSTVALAAVALYLPGVARLIPLLAGAAPKWQATLHWSVACLIVWTGVRWRSSARTRGAD